MTTKAKDKLLARAGTIEGLEKLINRFWYSEGYRINRDTLAIENDSRTPPEGYRVTSHGGAFRFWQVEPTLELHPETAPRKPAPRPLSIDRTKQGSLFDAGRNDLPGQGLLFPDIATQGEDSGEKPLTADDGQR